MSRDTIKPFSPSVAIIPNIKNRPRRAAKYQLLEEDMEIENKATWLKVSKEKAKRAPIKVIQNALYRFRVRAKKPPILIGGCNFVLWSKQL